MTSDLPGGSTSSFRGPAGRSARRPPVDRQALLHALAVRLVAVVPRMTDVEACRHLDAVAGTVNSRLAWLDDHLAAFPDALRSGSSDVPAVFIRLAYTLYTRRDTRSWCPPASTASRSRQPCRNGPRAAGSVRGAHDAGRPKCAGAAADATRSGPTPPTGHRSARTAGTATLPAGRPAPAADARRRRRRGRTESRSAGAATKPPA